MGSLRKWPAIGQIKEILQPGATMSGSWNAKGNETYSALYSTSAVLNIDIPGNCVDVDILEGLDDEDWYF